jgi:hypothetical protein
MLCGFITNPIGLDCDCLSLSKIIIQQGSTACWLMSNAMNACYISVNTLRETTPDCQRPIKVLLRLEQGPDAAVNWAQIWRVAVVALRYRDNFSALSLVMTFFEDGLISTSQFGN